MSSGNVVKKGVSYQPDVYSALEKFAYRECDGNFSLAQDLINRRFFRFVVKDTKTLLKQRTLI